MASAFANLSIPAVMQLLDQKQDRLAELAVLREEMIQQIENLERKMHRVAAMKPRRQVLRPRLPNTGTLKSFIMKILRKHKKGLSLDELTEKVVDAGYRSHSTKFQFVVYQCLYHLDEVHHDSRTKLYILKR